MLNTNVRIYFDNKKGFVYYCGMKFKLKKHKFVNTPKKSVILTSDDVSEILRKAFDDSFYRMLRGLR
jgi:hypothetical protein